MLKLKLMDCLLNLNKYEIIDLHNEYCEENSYYSDRIEYMDSFDDLFYDVKIQDFLSRYDVEDFRFNDEFFTIDDNGDLHSFNEDELFEDKIFYDGIYDMIYDNLDYYRNNTYIAKLKELLDEYESEE